MKTRTVYVAYTNTDCNEGRGRDVPHAICETEATARRRASRCYTQGSDGPVRASELIELDGKWYAPIHLIRIEPPTQGDIEHQRRLDARKEAAKRAKDALAKAKAAGLTDEDIEAITGQMK